MKRRSSESEKVLNATLVQCNIDLKRFQGTLFKLRALRFSLSRARSLSSLLSHSSLPLSFSLSLSPSLSLSLPPSLFLSLSFFLSLSLSLSLLPLEEHEFHGRSMCVPCCTCAPSTPK